MNEEYPARTTRNGTMERVARAQIKQIAAAYGYDVPTEHSALRVHGSGDHEFPLEPGQIAKGPGHISGRTDDRAALDSQFLSQVLTQQQP